MATRHEKCAGYQAIAIYGGDHPWLGWTTHGPVDSPAGPSMAAIDGLAGPILG